MTRFAPQGNVQRANNPLARQGKCCCCCSLRTGVIILSILMLIQSVLSTFNWYYYSENATSYYYSYNDSTDGGEGDEMHFGNDEGDDVITMTDDTFYTEDDDEGNMPPPQQGGEGGEMGPQQGGEGGEMPPQQGGQQGGGPATDTMVIEEDDSTMEDLGGDEDREPHGGNDNDNMGSHDGGERGDIEVDSEEEVEVDIPTWFIAAGWICIAWHYLGALLGMFAGCNYKRCCAFMFWMWWVISMTVSFAIGVLFMYFFGFHWCFLAFFTFVMVLGLYITCKVKSYHNLLKGDAAAPAGYSDIYAESV